MKHFIASLTCLATLGSIAAACPVVVRKKVVVAEVVTPIVAVAPIAVPVVAVAAVIPTYGAAYVPPPATTAVAATPSVAPAPVAPAQDPCEKRLEAILKRLESLERGTKPAAPAMPRADEKPEQVPAPKADANKQPAFLAAKCASCHTEGKLNAGTSFVLLATTGKVKDLDARQQLNILKRINRAPGAKGAMPPADSGHAALTDEEAGEMSAFIDTLK